MTRASDFGSAITVRLGIAGGVVLGGFAAYWFGTLSAPAGEGVLTWPVVAGALAGFAVSFAALTWLARRHQEGGAVAGAALAGAAALALLARLAWRRW